MEKIVIATNNQGKIKEIKQIFKEYEFLTLKEMNCNLEVEENMETFEGNSLKKAKEISDNLNMPCIADDSGLCIDVFDGWPGVHTARFLGENSTAEQRNKAILERMKNLNGKERTAEVKCVVTYYYKGKQVNGTGEIKGRISMEPNGDNGFGFDSIFELENGKTMAQLSSEEKNQISHRAIALKNLKKNLTNI